MHDPVTFTPRGPVGIFCLNRPDVHNAVDAQVIGSLETWLDRIEADPGLRVVVLTGAGSKTFCAGGDLAYFATLTSSDAGMAMSRRMQALLARLATGPRPVIAAINGDAWGGGCEILTACHLRIAAAGARFGFRQAAMGVITGWGGGARLFRLVGRSQALRLLLTAATFDAEEALRIGFIDRVVAAAELSAAVLALAEQIAANAPASVRAFLRLAELVESADPVTLSEAETQLFGECWTGDHFRQKVAAWSAQRAAEKK